jgi:hypothetical protein
VKTKPNYTLKTKTGERREGCVVVMREGRDGRKKVEVFGVVWWGWGVVLRNETPL